jgi:hypothetical protein
MAEVEAQAVGRVQAALLRHMIAKRAAQRLVQQVGGRVVGADLAAAVVRHFKLGGLALEDGALAHRGDVVEDAGRLAGIGHLGHAGIGADEASIADLAAASA